MEEIAKIYNVNIGENFILENASGYNVGMFKFDKDGLFQYMPSGMNYELKLYYDYSDIIIRILNGTYGIRKLSNEKVIAEALK